MTVVRSHACLGTSLLLVALNTATQPTLATLAPITVTGGGEKTLMTEAYIGSNLGLTPMQTPASVDIISREQITSRDESSVTSAIAKAPGFSAVPHPGNGTSALSVRGFTDGASVMQLYDGLRQYGGVGVTFPF